MKHLRYVVAARAREETSCLRMEPGLHIDKNNLNEGNAAPIEVSECYLGLTKITDLRGREQKFH